MSCHDCNEYAALKVRLSEAEAERDALQHDREEDFAEIVQQRDEFREWFQRLRVECEATRARAERAERTLRIVRDGYASDADELRKIAGEAIAKAEGK